VASNWGARPAGMKIRPFSGEVANGERIQERQHPCSRGERQPRCPLRPPAIQSVLPRRIPMVAGRMRRLACLQARETVLRFPPGTNTLASERSFLRIPHREGAQPQSGRAITKFIKPRVQTEGTTPSSFLRQLRPDSQGRRTHSAHRHCRERREFDFRQPVCYLRRILLGG
jgi:hypothetical protein